MSWVGLGGAWWDEVRALDEVRLDVLDVDAGAGREGLYRRMQRSEEPVRM